MPLEMVARWSGGRGASGRAARASLVLDPSPLALQRGPGTTPTRGQAGDEREEGVYTAIRGWRAQMTGAPAPACCAGVDRRRILASPLLQPPQHVVSHLLVHRKRHVQVAGREGMGEGGGG